MKLTCKHLAPIGIFLFILIIFATCKPAKHITTNTTVNSSGENFDEIYNRFHSDSLFQMSRIKFPLKGTSIDGNGEKKWLVKLGINKNRDFWY
jgi:hypothetical protein